MRPIAAALLLAAAAPSWAAAPITLDDALAEAARTSVDLRLSRADVAIAGADRTTSISGVLPRLDLSVSAGRAFQGATSARAVTIGGVTFVSPAVPETNVAQYSAGLQLRQTVFDWETYTGIQASGWSVRGNERLYEETALTLSFEVTRRFYELVRETRSLAVLEKTAVRSQELVDRADALFTAGKAPKSDTYTARVNLQNDRIAAEQQRIRVEQARSALAQILGRTTAEDLDVVPPAAVDAPGVPTGEPPPLDALVARARERRPTVVAQRAFVEAAKASASGARAGYLPAVAVQGAYNRNGQNLGGTDGVVGDPTRAYDASALVVLSWNLFEGRATSARIARAEGTLERARATAYRAETDVAKEVADARAQAVSLRRQIALASDTLQIARQALDLAAQRLEAGLANQLELRDANLKLTQAELTLLQTRIDHAVAIADLARAAGGAL
ncbi:TolC family protein [Anaeromyxobacter oryzae]|uniref:Outer membrane efflux protein n=1 Tax=Anaeromyxobacter oryzae TaxID=2918170 RepID=A0ABM7WUW9_9BACT|nr:TolC family protein [Anaeromyxobacter oryzae]BDG03266.1 hypothetical protein AMOR_22620 [Anaeromyxobacter oryzae]